MWIGVAVQVVGQIVDSRWHAAHPGIESAAEMVEAHWVIWLGVAIAWTAALLTLLPKRGHRGALVIGIVGLAYALGAAWDLVEHARGSDSAAAHVLLASSQVAILFGVILATVDPRRRVAAR
jgi:hypothetical protein